MDNKKDRIVIDMHIDDVQSLLDALAFAVGLSFIRPNKNVDLQRVIKAVTIIVASDKSGRLKNRLSHEAAEFTKFIEEL